MAVGVLYIQPCLYMHLHAPEHAPAPAHKPAPVPAPTPEPLHEPALHLYMQILSLPIFT